MEIHYVGKVLFTPCTNTYNPYFTPFCFTPLYSIASCQFTPLLNLRSLMFVLASFGGLRSNHGNPLFLMGMSFFIYFLFFQKKLGRKTRTGCFIISGCDDTVLTLLTSRHYIDIIMNYMKNLMNQTSLTILKSKDW